MMKSSIFYFLLIFLYSSSILFANGGPIDWSNVLNCGDIKLIHDERIEVIKEHMKIKIVGDYSKVNVVYTLFNKLNSQADVSYGFPIDILQDPYDSHFKLRKEDLPEITFKINNNILPIKYQLDFNVLDSEIKLDDEMKHEVKRSWHIVDFNLAHGQAELEVDFTVRSCYTDEHYSHSFFDNYGSRNFIYDFSPASRWGSGIVPEFTIEVDAKDIIRRQGEIKIKGLELAFTSDSLYVGQFQSFDLAKSPNLHLNYSNKIKKLSEFITHHRYGKYYLLDIWINNSKLTDDVKKSLFDDDLNTSVKVRLKNDKPIVLSVKSLQIPIGAMAIINGCASNENDFNTFSQVQKVKIKIKYENTKTFEYYLPYDADDPNTDINLPELKYMNKNDEVLSKMLTSIIDLGEENRKIDELIIECHEFRKGLEAILCIPEIYLLHSD